MTTKINNFVIFGERCSGTNFLEEAISKNFNLTISNEYGNKHFFCFNDFKNKNVDNTLFIGIIRNPIHWLNSFYIKPYHVPFRNRKLENFLFAPFYSIKDEESPKKFYSNNGEIVMMGFSRQSNSNDLFETNQLDLNYKTGRIYKNIFELRKNKNEYLINLKTKLKNYILINYENLLYNYEETLNNIKTQFNLEQSNKEFLYIKGYKKSTTEMFKGEKQITFDKKTLLLIWKNLDIEQEKSLGYFAGDNNKYFKNKYKNEK